MQTNATSQKTLPRLILVPLAKQCLEEAELFFEDFRQKSGVDPYMVWRNLIDQPFGIKDWRELAPLLGNASNQRPIWVAILDADTLSLDTQNALLKILEEPPNHVLFFLFSRFPKALLGTVRSRCQLVELPSIQTSDKTEQNGQTYLTDEQVDRVESIIQDVLGKGQAKALVASDQFADRQAALTWVEMAIVWSERQRHKLVSEPVSEVASERVSDQESEREGDRAGDQASDRASARTGEVVNNTLSNSSSDGTSDKTDSWQALNWSVWLQALLTAHQRLQQNGHVKLVMDQLFLQLKLVA